MGLLKRIQNIIKSNINHEEEPKNFDYSEEFYYEDSKPVIENELEKEYYGNLEIPVGSDFKTVKAAYKKLLKKYHPDFCEGNVEKQRLAEEITKKINEAYSYFERKFL